METKNEKVRAVIVAKGKTNVAYLSEALLDPDVRTIAARYLADIGARETIPQQLRLLAVADAGVRSAAIKALTRLDATEALPELLAMTTDDPSPVVRSHAVGAIRRLGDPKVVASVLLEALRDPDGGVSSCAAEELGWVGTASAIDHIRAASVGAHFLRRGGYRRAIRMIRARERRGEVPCE